MPDIIHSQPIGQIDSDFLIVSLKLMYRFFYFEPDSELLAHIQDSGILTDFGELLVVNSDEAQTFLIRTAALAELQADHLSLFVGLGMPKAMPWGSVYLHDEGLLMQDSTYALSGFLTNQGLRFQLQERQPLDHIGLCLSALASLLEREALTREYGTTTAIKIMLHQHLLPWSGQFCKQLIAHATTPVYKMLGEALKKLLIYLNDKYTTTIYC